MSTGINGITTTDLRNLACAATGAAINRADDTEELKQTLVFGGGLMLAPTAFKTGKAVVYDLPKWGRNNYGNYSNAFKTAWNGSFGQTNLYSANRQALKGDFWNTVQTNSLRTEFGTLNIPNYNFDALNHNAAKLRRLNNMLQPKESDSLLKAGEKAVKRNSVRKARINNLNNHAKAYIYKDANRLAEEAKNLQGKDLATKLKEVKQAETRAKIAVQEAKAAGKIKSATKLGRAASAVKTKTGVRAAQAAVLKGTLSKNTTVRVASKGVRAGGAMAVLSAAMETPTVCKTYKELGAAKGTKQLGKSLVKVGAETAGYVVGAKLGGIAGAKLGAVIGTCIGGPVGTAVGGAIGVVVGVAAGLLGSWLCGKAARAAVGEDELELAKKQQAEELTEAAKDNKDLQTELAAKARENLEAGNVASEKDANDIIESYNKVAENLSGEQITSATTEQTLQETQTSYDRGFLALLALAGKNTQSYNTSEFNSSFGYQSFNPFGFGFTNQYFMNPFMMNPYFGNYAA